MSLFHKIALVVAGIIIAIQFIRPATNKDGQVPAEDITKRLSIPKDIETTLRTSCYDCHSNNTKYPWYAHVQPIGWLLADHIKDGKAELNFSEFGSYSERRMKSKLKAIYNSVKDGSMPLSSYTLLHQKAKLSETDRTLLMNWTLKTADSLSRKDR